MFAVLDTNHITEFAEGSELGRGLVARLDERQAEAFTGIVAVEETMRGLLALLNLTPAAAASRPGDVQDIAPRSAFWISSIFTCRSVKSSQYLMA